MTLIELMVAMVLGLIVAGGIVTIFISTSSSNRTQTQLARLQEEGRFAISRLSNDLHMANGQYCTGTGGVAQAGTGGVYLDHLRSPKVYARNLTGALSDVTTAWGASSGGHAYPPAPSTPYSMPSFLFMRGYDCGLTDATCSPANPAAAGLPSMGKTLGARVSGTDVITVRYVNPSSGWAIGGPGASKIATSSSMGTINSITLIPDSSADEPPVTNFANGDLAMLADCSNAQIFPATASATGVIVPVINSTDGFGTGSSNTPAAQQPESAPKLFDVNRDLQTVTYYLKVVSVNNDNAAPFTGALMRRINGGDPTKKGGSEDELVRGIERLDFKYGVQDSSGNTSFLTASQIDASTNCPPAEINAITAVGCLWRGVTSIEVSILMDGQVPLYTLAADDMMYAYSIDGNTVAVAPESTRQVTPNQQGFVDQMLRREFTVLVALRNYNP
ncbi:PilW family protein [Rhodanobacter sp. L36]|uniref:PilW family protein n=1 Tax=Rhodanobacter sp. L36 TaxID=1747221 RepID=UPI00131C879C|nr:PilW family protein [Rhodanobacter sp. L36]